MDRIGTLIQNILDTLRALGRNFAPIPFEFSFEGGNWNVYIDVRCSRDRNFDIETRHADPATALKNALAQLRRWVSQ